MDDDIRFIVESGLYAASGDNLQELRWIVCGHTLQIERQDKDDILNQISDGRAAALSLGAMVENAVIAATARKYRTQVTYSSDPSGSGVVATLVVEPDANISPDPLARELANRVTNRKAYTRTPLTAEERTSILGVADAKSDVRLIEDPRSISTLARAVVIYDELIFSIRILHNKFFHLINWTKRADDRRRIGLYFPTLASPPFSLGPLWFLRTWLFARASHLFRGPYLIALRQRHIYRQASAYGAVIVHQDKIHDWIDAGRTIERLWLVATQKGLSLHPLTGTIFIALGSHTEPVQQMLSAEQGARVLAGYADIKKIFAVTEGTVAFMFRIGHGAPPSARTSRLPTEQMVDVVPATKAA